MKMKDYKELLKKFWAGDATEPEKLQLYKHIIQQEEEFRAAPEEDVVLEPADSRRILEALHKEIHKEGPRNRIFKIVRSMSAVAAAVITIILVVKWAFPTSTKSQVDRRAMASETTISNTLSHIMMVKLGDSSLVGIYPGSSISYPDSFNTGGERIVQLRGKASFKVQHNANKPFRVIAMQIMTTDIGTEFCIDALQPNVIKVILKEGSVRVEGLPVSNIAMNRKMQRPGEQLNINLATREITSVEPFKNSAAGENAAQNSVAAAKHAIRVKARLSFSRTPLAEVFARLAQREQVKIQFDKTDMDGLTFTGNIEPKDPLDLSLNILCGLNGLSYTKTEHGIAITKNK